MCAKFNRLLAGLVPQGPVREALKGSYYHLYYNRKHFKENNFHVFYSNGHFEYLFPDGVRFASHENMADELKRSLFGYIEKRRLKRGDVVVDCGAYFGEFTLYAAKAAGEEGRVIAFEPDPEVYKRLEANVALNGLSNVLLVRKGVWSKDDALKFTSDDIKGHSFMLAQPGERAEALPVVSLDNELARLGVKRVDFIKMDIEGAEIEAIKGARRTLESNDVELAIGSYHKVDGKKTCQELERLLVEFGYSVETSHPSHLTTYANKIKE